MSRIAFVALVAAILGVATASPTVKAIKCLRANNNFLNYLSSNTIKEVQIFETPQKGLDQCGDEWRNFGTCCKVSDLITYAQNDADKLRNHYTNLRQLMENYSSLFSEILSDLPRFKTTNKINDDRAHLMKALLDLASTKLSGTLNNLATRLDKKKQFDSCWEQMITLRSSSLCSTCSGRSLVFVHAKKAMISASSCHSLVTNCKFAFRLLIEFLEAIKTIAEQLNDFSPESRSLTKELSNACREASRNQIQKAINALVTSDYADQAAEALLCSKFVRFEGPSFVELMHDILDIDIGLFYKVRNKLNQRRLLTRNPRKLSNVNWTIPVKETSTQFQTIFEGDVFVIEPKFQAKIDSSYVSTIGAAGTQGNMMSSWLRVIPMNLSLAFP